MNAAMSPSLGSLWWLVAAMLAATAPFLLTLPLWIQVVVVVIAIWRCTYANHRGQGLRRWQLIVVLGIALALLVATGSFGMGLEGTTPIFVTLVWLKALEMRNERDYALVCFLCYFMVAMVLFDQQSLLRFAFSLFAWGLTSVALARVFATTSNGAALRVAIRICIQAIPVAAVIFLLLPQVQVPFPSLSHQGMSGFTRRMRPGDIASVAISHRLAFRASFPQGQMPNAEDLYWRGLVLSQSEDGEEWQERGSGYLILSGAERSYKGGGGRLIEQTISLMPTNQKWMFALESAQVAPEGARLRVNMTVTANHAINSILDYSVSSQIGARAHDADESASRPLTQVSPKVVALAQGLAQGTTSADQAAQRVIDFFHDPKQGFTYSLHPGLATGDFLSSFLFVRRSGFCSHYASAFVALMRVMTPIHPARVVVGYRGGELNTIGDFINVRQEHAHAWVEVLEEDHSWRRYDPTEGIPIAVGEDLSTAQNPNVQSSFQQPEYPTWLPGFLKTSYRQANQYWQYAEARWDHLFTGYDSEQQDSLLSRFGLGHLGMLARVGLMVVVVVVLLGLIALCVRWRWGGRRDALSDAYTDFCRRLAAAGMTRHAWEGPLDFAERAGQALPGQRTTILGISSLYARLRYAPDPGDAATRRDDLKTMRRLIDTLL
jgi:transglutaminase-like putative cysteine protease